MSQDDTSDHEKRLEEARQLWDRVAAIYDEEPDHGLGDAQMRHAWTELLRSWLPAARSAILDIGCGTGSLSMVMAGLGHAVTGIDISVQMITRALAKANVLGYNVDFLVMDAAVPLFMRGSFDCIVCRHLLWTLPEPPSGLQHWTDLLRPGGRLILIEGYWSTGAGLHAPEIIAALPASVSVVAVQNLSHQPEYWGKVVTDERYIIIADHHYTNNVA